MSYVSVTFTSMAHQVETRILQKHASEIVKRAASGEVLEITEGGRLVARMVPAGMGVYKDLCAAGLIRQATHPKSKLPAPKPVANGTPTASEVLAGLRQFER